MSPKQTGINKVNKQEFIQLTEQFGLPCIERSDFLYVIGEEQIIIWRIIDDNIDITRRSNLVFSS